MCHHARVVPSPGCGQFVSEVSVQLEIPVVHGEGGPVENRSGRENEQLLDEGRDLAYQHREWVVQRIGWVIIALVIVAALLGLTGSVGPFAAAHKVATDGSIEISYTQLERHHAPADLVIEVGPGFAEANEVRLWLGADYAHSLGVQSIVPEPDSVELAPERVTYVFTVVEGEGPLEITFSYEHDGFWKQEARLGLENGTPVEFSQFIFP